jgi:trehalose 6-phosphate phosphatase
VVSGRPASFLVEWLDHDGLRLAGLYGMEAVEGGKVVVHPDVGRWRKVVEEAAHHTEVSGPREATIERKGLSVTLHFRRAPHAEDVVRAWAEVEAARTGLVMHPARMSYELRPPTDRDKGTVVREMGAGRAAVCFIGDDRGDLPAFDALDDLAAAGAHTVRVAVMSSEAPPELLQRADIRVDGPKGVVALLKTLTESVGA